MSPQRILVTGATGVVGSEVVRGLIGAGHVVYCLLNRRPDLVTNSGRVLHTAPAPLSNDNPGLYAVKGNLRDPDLGLGTDLRRRLAESIDTVVHCAAITTFGLPEAEYMMTNTEGTRNLLSFIRQNDNISLIHVSTAYVCGKRSGQIDESELDVGQELGNPYELSKLNAERLVREAIDNGLRAAVLRPSIVVGSSKDGRIREFSNIYVVLKALTEGRVRAIPGNYDAVLDLVPIDYVAACIVEAAAKIDAVAGNTYHIVGRTPVSLRQFSDVLAEFPSFHVPRFVQPEAFDFVEQTPAEARLYQKVIRLYESYFVRQMRFSNANVRRDLKTPLAPLGQNLVRKILNHAVTAGYLARAAMKAAAH